jgi:pectinesterase
MAIKGCSKKMKRPLTISSIFYSLLLGGSHLFAQQVITVSQDGSGMHRTIQGALNSIPDHTKEGFTIKIAKGIYHEKLYIEKANITLEGSNKAETVISASIARDAWRCHFQDDWGVATVNVAASDITLKSLTIENRYGFENKATATIDCPTDATGQKVIGSGGHQMALRTMNGATKLSAFDCHFKAFGGDTVSPWEVNHGMWYFKDCQMEGAVDLYCPRGWAWAENCHFTVHGGTAAIWHDGSKHPDSKTILVNCRFSGFDGFMLGRYHRDAQFYLIDCVFDANMRDSAIYRVPTTNIIQWGHRVYYAGCKRLAEPQYTWYRDNLPTGLAKKDITVEWLFNKKWNPTIL